METEAGKGSKSATVATLKTTVFLWIPSNLVLRAKSKKEKGSIVTDKDVSDLLLAIQKRIEGAKLTKKNKDGYTIEVPHTKEASAHAALKTLCHKRGIILSGNIQK